MPTVLIAGASRGIGLEFAKQYGAAGWDVIATCRDDAAAETLSAIPGMKLVLSLDVGDGEAIDGLGMALSGQPIDLLLLNAAIHPQWQRPPIEETDFDIWPEVFRINTVAPIRIALALSENVARSEKRIIAAMSSGAGSIARRTGGNHIYCSSKAALNICVRSLSEEWRDRGITVVALAPGGVRTDMNQRTAARPVDDAVADLRSVIDGITPADSGRFIDYDGSDIPW